MQITDLPVEILENIIYYCNYESFVNFSKAFPTVLEIFKKYRLDSLPKYMGIVKFAVRKTQILLNNSNDDSDNYSDDDSDEVSNNESQTNVQIISKFIITSSIKKITKFFLRYLDNNDIQYVKCYFKKIKNMELININRLDNFLHFKYTYGTDLSTYIFNDYVNAYEPVGIPLYKMINESNSRNRENFLSELKTIEYSNYKLNKTINQIITFLGENKLNKTVTMLKIIVKEYDICPVSSILSFTTIRIINADLNTSKCQHNIKNILKNDIKELSLYFKLCYPFIDIGKPLYSFNEIQLEKEYSLYP